MPPPYPYQQYRPNPMIAGPPGAPYGGYDGIPPPAVQPSGIWAPDVAQAWGAGGRGLADIERQMSAYGPGPAAPDITKRLEEVGAYQPFPWEIPQVEMPTYQQFQYGFQAPELERTQYDWAQRYQAPAPYEAARFEAPQIAEIERLAPEAQGIWAARRTAEQERMTRQFQDVRSQIQDAIASGQTRPEQAAALLARVGEQEETARRGAAREMDIAESQQLLGIRGQEQQLGFQRGMRQAEFGQWQQEAQARELAQTYGLSVDAARYMVAQQQQQQQAQTEERLGAAQFGLQRGQAEFGAQQAQAGERRYGFEQEAGAATFQAGLQQWQQEQQAAEAQRAYQSRYGLAQDIGQAQQARWEAGRASQYDYWNALMQAQQAQAQRFGMAATYEQNLSESQRNKLQQERAQTQAQAQMPAAQYGQQQKYRMPSISGQAVSRGPTFRAARPGQVQPGGMGYA